LMTSEYTVVLGKQRIPERAKKNTTSSGCNLFPERTVHFESYPLNRSRRMEKQEWKKSG
jgi:hypothetical protein